MVHVHSETKNIPLEDTGSVCLFAQHPRWKKVMGKQASGCRGAVAWLHSLQAGMALAKSIRQCRMCLHGGLDVLSSQCLAAGRCGAGARGLSSGGLAAGAGHRGRGLTWAGAVLRQPGTVACAVAGPPAWYSPAAVLRQPGALAAADHKNTPDPFSAFCFSMYHPILPVLLMSCVASSSASCLLTDTAWP